MAYPFYKPAGTNNRSAGPGAIGNPRGKKERFISSVGKSRYKEEPECCSRGKPHDYRIVLYVLPFLERTEFFYHWHWYGPVHPRYGNVFPALRDQGLDGGDERCTGDE